MPDPTKFFHDRTPSKITLGKIVKTDAGAYVESRENFTGAPIVLVPVNTFINRGWQVREGATYFIETIKTIVNIEVAQ